MYVLSSGFRLARCRSPLLLIAVAVQAALAGCASDRTQAPADNWAADSSMRIAEHASQMDAPVRRVRLEADGLESQTPPYLRDVREPDDPSEPYSPNYGRRNMERADAPMPIDASYVPADLPIEFRRKLAASLH